MFWKLTKYVSRWDLTLSSLVQKEKKNEFITKHSRLLRINALVKDQVRSLSLKTMKNRYKIEKFLCNSFIHTMMTCFYKAKPWKCCWDRKLKCYSSAYYFTIRLWKDFLILQFIHTFFHSFTTDDVGRISTVIKKCTNKCY